MGVEYIQNTKNGECHNW